MVAEIIKLYANIPDDAVFLHCKNCCEKEQKDDLAVFVFEEGGSSFVTIWCERCDLEVSTCEIKT